MNNEIYVGNWSVLGPSRAMATTRKPSGARYHKPQQLLDFENEYNAAHAAKFYKIPPECLARTHFSDKDANSLTRAIIAHLTFHGYFAARVNTTGIYDQRRGQWRTTSARRGMADISAVINGRAVQFEIKAGNDRPRADQIKVRAEVQAAGGVYEFVHDFAEYIELYNRLTAKPP